MFETKDETIERSEFEQLLHAKEQIESRLRELEEKVSPAQAVPQRVTVEQLRRGTYRLLPCAKPC